MNSGEGVIMFFAREGGFVPARRCLCALGSALSGCHAAAALGTAVSSKTRVVPDARAVTSFAAEVQRMTARFRFPQSHR